MPAVFTNQLNYVIINNNAFLSWRVFLEIIKFDVNDIGSVDFDIPLDFSNCEQTTGTVVIKLISYFSNEETSGANFYIDYAIEGNKVVFSIK